MADALVPIEILGQRYPVRSALDPRYVQELAIYLDAKMRAAADITADGDSLRVAVVAALNITDEYFRARGADEGHQVEFADRLRRIEALIDQALDGA